MTKRICIVGAPSCRKSTVATRLEAELKCLGLNADIAEEYARTYIQRYGVPFTPFQQLLIFSKQTQREKDIMSTEPDFMITDTAPWFGAVYTQMLINQQKYGDPRAYTHLLGTIVKYSVENIKTYDYIFYFPLDDNTNIKDGVRTQTDIERAQLDDAIRGFLSFMSMSNINYYTVRGTVEEKVDYIMRALGVKE